MRILVWEAICQLRSDLFTLGFRSPMASVARGSADGPDPSTYPPTMYVVLCPARFLRPTIRQNIHALSYKYTRLSFGSVRTSSMRGHANGAGVDRR